MKSLQIKQLSESATLTTRSHEHDTDRFYALIDGELQLVWERDGE